MIFSRWYNCLLERSQGFNAIKLQILVYIGASSTIFLIKNNYDRLYGGNITSSSLDRECRKSEGMQLTLSSELETRQRDGGVDSREKRKVTDLCPDDDELHWRDFPKISPWFIAYKYLSIVWFIYAIFQYFALEVYRDQLTGALALEYPLHCFLLGRLFVNEKFARFVACISSIIQLLWRLNLFCRPPSDQSSAIYFMLINQADLELFYSRLTPHLGVQLHANSGEFQDQKSIIMSLKQVERLTYRQMFFLETMCFRVDTPTSVHYLLRPNRGAESHRKLRRLIAKSTIQVLLVPLFTSIVTLAHAATNLSTYMLTYRECDPHWSNSDKENRVEQFSSFLILHYLLVVFMDFSINIFILAENGLVLLFGASFLRVINYDLMLYWEDIDERIKSLRRVYASRKWAFALAHTEVGQTGDRVLRALEAEILDFFNELERTNLGASDGLTLAVFVWLYLIAAFTYFTQIKSIDVPPSLILFIVMVITCIILICCAFLTLNQQCTHTYPSLCSLVALLKPSHRRVFHGVMDMYVLKKTCYTLFGGYSYRPTTLLAIFGYSLSCFFLVSNMLQSRDGCDCSVKL